MGFVFDHIKGISASLILPASLFSLANHGQQSPNQQQEMCCINSPVRPLNEKGYGLFATGSFLWWKATQDDLYYVAKTTTQSCLGNFILNSFDGTLHDPNFEWDPGFKIGLGYNLPYDGWDLYVNWTRFYTSASNHQRACLCPPETISRITLPTNQSSPCNIIRVPTQCQPCADDVLYPTFAPVITSDQYATTVRAKSHWNLHLNLLDGELGRDFYVGKKLTLRPSIGLRGAWIDQRLNVNYKSNIHIVNPINAGFGIQSASLIGISQSCSEFKNDFEGVGPKFGIDTDWILGYGFSIYGDAGISLIWGEFDIESEATFTLCAEFNATTTTDLTFATNVNQPSCYRLKDEFHSTKAITDLALGIQWKTSMWKRTALLLQLGWEHHLFFNQNQLVRLTEQVTPFALAPLVPGVLQTTIPNLTSTQTFVAPRRSGDLAVQGLTFTARLDF
jgi:Legionella pneumophila major outer membrane protein precursor